MKKLSKLFLTVIVLGGSVFVGCNGGSISTGSSPPQIPQINVPNLRVPLPPSIRLPSSPSIPTSPTTPSAPMNTRGAPEPIQQILDATAH